MPSYGRLQMYLVHFGCPECLKKVNHIFDEMLKLFVPKNATEG